MAKKIRVISGILTLVVIIVLLLSGPANAVILGLSVLDDDVDVGEETNLVIGMEIEDNEFFNISKFELILSGPIIINCEFDSDGNVLAGCPGMTITAIEKAPFNFGYGFEKGNFTFNIKINTANYSIGVYSSKLKVYSESIIEKTGQDITIRGEGIVDKCSVRADSGSVKFGTNNNGKKNKLNFFIPLKNAVAGTGYLTSQDKRTRFSYDFIIKDVLENKKDNLIVAVEGEYRIGTGDSVEEDAVIYFDKKNKKADVIGSSFEAKNMKVGFIEGCLF